jgi:hypothetical protein
VKQNHHCSIGSVFTETLTAKIEIIVEAVAVVSGCFGSIYLKKNGGGGELRAIQFKIFAIFGSNYVGVI